MIGSIPYLAQLHRPSFILGSTSYSAMLLRLAPPRHGKKAAELGLGGRTTVESTWERFDVGSLDMKTVRHEGDWTSQP